MLSLTWGGGSRLVDLCRFVDRSWSLITWVILIDNIRRNKLIAYYLGHTYTAAPALILSRNSGIPQIFVARRSVAKPNAIDTK